MFLFLFYIVKSDKMNLTLSALRLQNSFSRSPLIVSRKVSIVNSKFNRIFSPISFNPRKLLMANTMVEKAEESAVVTEVQITGVVLSPFSFSYKNAVNISVFDCLFKQFSKTVFIAKSEPNCKSTIDFKFCNFQKIRSSTEGGCIYSTFFATTLEKCCADKCHSSKSGNFLSGTQTVKISTTAIIRTSEDSNCPAIVCPTSGGSFTMVALNVSKCVAKDDTAFLYINKCELSHRNIFVCNNTGKSIVLLRNIENVVIFGEFYFNRGNELGCIRIENSPSAYLECNFVGNDSPLMDGENVLDFQFHGQCDSPAVSKLEKLFPEQFKLDVATMTFRGSKPNVECVFSPPYVRPKLMVDILTACFSVTGITILVSIAYISYDIYSMKKKYIEDSSDPLRAVLNL